MAGVGLTDGQGRDALRDRVVSMQAYGACMFVADHPLSCYVVPEDDRRPIDGDWILHVWWRSGVWERLVYPTRLQAVRAWQQYRQKMKTQMVAAGRPWPERWGDLSWLDGLRLPEGVTKI